MSPCEHCHAGCCRSFAIPLTGADVIRIERGLGLSFWDVACRWADPDGLIARRYAPHFFFDDEPRTPFVIALLHEPSRYFPHSTRCRFLVEGEPDADHPLGQARCGVYGVRPAACRVFPTKFNPTGELAVIHDVPAGTRGDGDPVYSLCPRPWEPADLDPVQPLHDLLTARYEMAVFHRLAALWNRVPRPWDAFPEFLHLVYERRVVRENPAGVAGTQPVVPLSGTAPGPAGAGDPHAFPEPGSPDSDDAGRLADDTGRAAPHIVPFPRPGSQTGRSRAA